MSCDRSIHLFLSGTFRDFDEERKLLVEQVFMTLRARLKERFVELVDVDLRWGITQEKAERGEVLPICLAEIDRSRPYFIAMLGERYGWIPPVNAFSESLLQAQPWLNNHTQGKSITELEILHCVLNDPSMTGRTYFYLRSAQYAQDQGKIFMPCSTEEATRQRKLKDFVLNSGFPVVEYAHPQELAERLLQDLWNVFDEAYPASSVPAPLERERLRHEAYAALRRRLYLGGERYIDQLNGALSRGAQRILIQGESGSGKSALLSNWAQSFRQQQPKWIVFEHYSAIDPEAAYPETFVRRLMETIAQVTLSTDVIPEGRDLFDSLPQWLAQASAHALKENIHWVIVLDAINILRSGRHLRWFPSFLPERIHVLVSCLPTAMCQRLLRNGQWVEIHIEPMNAATGQKLLATYLGKFGKKLRAELSARALEHPLAGNALFLLTMAEELRLFGDHEKLESKLDDYLKSNSINDLFEMVLARVESLGETAVRSVMRALWVSRSGLTEEEILKFAGLVQANWAPIRNGLNETLMASSGRIGFSHDYVRTAVKNRYLSSDKDVLRARMGLAGWYATGPLDRRRAFEQPYQLWQAKAWTPLKDLLLNRESFLAIHRFRNNQELLRYWLALRRALGVDPQNEYEAIWLSWTAKDEPDLDTIERLRDFLIYAGYSGDFCIQVARACLARCRSMHGENDLRIARQQLQLADLLRDRRELEDSSSEYRDAIARLKDKGKSESLEFARALGGLSKNVLLRKEFTLAEKLAREALDIRERLYGETSMHTLRAINLLSEIIRRQRRFSDAIDLQRRALSIVKQRCGLRHRDASIFMMSIGLLFQDLNKYPAAERAFQSALGTREKLLGTDHPMTNDSRLRLALLLIRDGQEEKAQELLTDGLSLCAARPEPANRRTALRIRKALLQLRQ